MNNPPSTTEGLVSWWERLDLAERLEFLRALNCVAVDKLTNGLVAGGLLGEVITTLLAFTPTVLDVLMVVNILQSMTQAKRRVNGYVILHLILLKIKNLYNYTIDT